MEDTSIHLSCRTPLKDANKIDKLVDDGAYLNRSDFMRASLKKLLAEHQ